MNCPNKNSKEWQRLVSSLGEEGAYKMFVSLGETLPPLFFIDELLNQMPNKLKVKENDKTPIKEFLKTNELYDIGSEFKKRGDRSYKFVFDKAEGLGITINNEPADSLDVSAYFDSLTNKITITSKFEMLNKTAQVRTIAAKSIHGIVTKLIDNFSEDEINLVSKDLNNFISEIESNEKLKGNEEVLKVLDTIKRDTNNGWKNLIEEALTNSKFAAALNSVVLSGEAEENKTFWSKLKELILSIVSDDRTMLDELTDILDYHFDVDNINNLSSRIKVNKGAIPKRSFLEEQGYPTASYKKEYLSEFVDFDEMDLEGETIIQYCK